MHARSRSSRAPIERGRALRDATAARAQHARAVHVAPALLEYFFQRPCSSLPAMWNDGDDDEAMLPTWSRTYAGYRERFVQPFELQLGDARLMLEQAPCVSAEHARESKASADGSCTASTVWDAGIVLAGHENNVRVCFQLAKRCKVLRLGVEQLAQIAAAATSAQPARPMSRPAVTSSLCMEAANRTRSGMWWVAPGATLVA